MTGRFEQDAQDTSRALDAVWRKQVATYLQRELSFSTAEKTKLRASLLATAKANPDVLPAHVVVATRTTKPWWKRFALDYVMVALAAAGLVAIVLPRPAANESLDALTDLLSIPTMRSYPPDFDLEGDADALGDIMQDVFPADAELPFSAEFPAHLATKFQPTEGRFFTWAGEPGVSIRLLPAALTRVSASSPNGSVNSNAAVNLSSLHGTTLYIVKLNGIAEQKFPKEREVKRIASRSGKERRVHVWRDGGYGYAVVQNAGSASGDFFPDEPSEP